MQEAWRDADAFMALCFFSYALSNEACLCIAASDAGHKSEAADRRKANLEMIMNLVF